MVRPPLSSEQRLRGQQLGQALRAARGSRSMVDVAGRAGISVETLRKIETGRVPTPAFFTVAALASVLEVPLNALVAHAAPARSGPDLT